MKMTFMIVSVAVFVLLLTAVPVYAQFSGGAGTSGDPWRIANADDLNNIRNYLGIANTNQYFRQTANIDLIAYSAGEGWVPIGNSTTRFFGNYDGRNYTISNLTISKESDAAFFGVGLFGYIASATIIGVRMTGANIDCRGLEERIGVLSGFANNSTIENCRVSGEISAKMHVVGGMIGRVDGTTVDNCQAHVNVTVNAPVEPIIYNLGGLIGRNVDGSVISNSRATGNLTGVNVSRVGGLVGDNATVSTANGGIINNSFATGDVTGDANVGGLVGRNYSIPAAAVKSSISNSYSTGLVGCESLSPSGTGGLVGLNDNSTISESWSESVVTGFNWVGGLVGHNSSETELTGDNRSSIWRCYAKGDVNSFRYNTGGLVGRNNNAIIRQSFALGNVTTTQIGEEIPFNTGGLAGRNINNSVIENCYAAGHVNGERRAAGLVGQNNLDSGESAQIINSYSVGQITGNTASWGGLIGAEFSGSVTNSYWDTSTSGLATSPAGLPLNTPQMVQQANFTEWDFVNVWTNTPGVTYPYFVWQTEVYDGNIAPLTLAFAAGTYSIDLGAVPVIFTPADGHLGGAEIKVKCSTSPNYSSVQLFPRPQHLSAYYGFWFDNQSVLVEGQSFQLRFPADDHPNSIFYRHAGGEWKGISEARITYLGTEPNYTYLIDIEGLIPALRDSTASIEFAADKGNEAETLPVQLSSFTASVTANREVRIEWITESESNMLGYNVLRNDKDSLDEAEKITANIIPADNSSETRKYIYTDTEVTPGSKYFYWLELIEMDLSTSLFGPVSVMVAEEGEDGGVTPPELATKLMGAFPNPFNISTSIKFSLKNSDNVTITIFNTKGQIIRTLVSEGSYPKGEHTVVWDGTDAEGRVCSSGIYMYSFKTTTEYHSIKKMMLLK